MSVVKPITILTQNLIERDMASLFLDGGEVSVIFNFPEGVSADTLLLKDVFLDSVLLEHALAPEAPWQALPPVDCAGQSDIIFNFPEPLQAQVIKLTFRNAAGECRAGQIILARNLLDLNNVLSTVTDGKYTRGGQHYMADGALVSWREFTKQAPQIRLENVDKQSKEALLALINGGGFCTYIFYGGYEAAASGEFALSRPPMVNLDRKTMRYQIDFSLSER